MSWTTATAAPMLQQQQQHTFTPEVERYAGFWRRYWGLHVDSVLLGVLIGLAGFLINLAGTTILGATQSCVTQPYAFGNVRSCRVSSGMAWFILGLHVVVNLTIWYRVVPRRLANGGTPGMRQLGLRIQDAGDGTLIGGGAALGRSLLPGLLQLGGMVAVAVAFGLLVDGGPREAGFGWWFGASVGLALACYGPAMWQLVDRRHQTLYDKLVGSVVVAERRPNWWAVASFACATTIVLAPLAIVFGHVALHGLGDARNRQAGGGLALVGTALGYLVVLGAAVVAAVVAST